jgi:hypothetical protein
VHIVVVSGERIETPEQTLERLGNGGAIESTVSGEPGRSGVTKLDQYPVPNVDRVAAYRGYREGWAPDALVFLHPELFPARERAARVQVEVAVFALAAAGLIRLSAWQGLRFSGETGITISPLDGLSSEDITSSRPGWVSDLILTQVYKPPAGWLSLDLCRYPLTRRVRRTAVESELATTHKDQWWKPPSTVSEARCRQASAPAATELAREWTQFTSDYPVVRKALRGSTGLTRGLIQPTLAFAVGLVLLLAVFYLVVAAVVCPIFTVAWLANGHYTAGLVGLALSPPITVGTYFLMRKLNRPSSTYRSRLTAGHEPRDD